MPRASALAPQAVSGVRIISFIQCTNKILSSLFILMFIRNMCVQATFGRKYLVTVLALMSKLVGEMYAFYMPH